MALQEPRLDERSFAQLVADVQRELRARGTAWNDLTPHDPGIVLLEAFAFLTEQTIRRFNRLPHRAFVAFLDLLGVKLVPPSAAQAELEFQLPQPARQTVRIPEGTRVGGGRAEGGQAPVVFTTSREATIPVGEKRVAVTAHHCDWLDEAKGQGTGAAGQWVSVERAPIVAPMADDIDLVVGVELGEGESPGAGAREFSGATYGIWREVESFAEIEPNDRVFVVDRVAGRITFAPAMQKREGAQLEAMPVALAAAPGAGRRIHVWYRRGGGALGNVPAGALSEIRSTLPAAGLSVSNPVAASGGRDGERLENALVRGPLELHSLQRAVTARDYELWAVKHAGGVERALAITQIERWKFAEPGTVELVVVPALSSAAGDGRVRAEDLRQREQAVDPQLRAMLAELEQRQPLGTRCVARWARYKHVEVRARVVVHRAEDLEALRNRVLGRLHRAINPLRTSDGDGWPFGTAVRASHIYAILLGEPGVRWVDPVKLVVEEVPHADVKSIDPDRWQPKTWYAVSAGRLFRSENRGAGWERLQLSESANALQVRASPDFAGHVAVLERGRGEDEKTIVRVSQDCGETFPHSWSIGWQVDQIAWGTSTDNRPVLFLASDKGLHRLRVEAGTTPQPIDVIPGQKARVTAVATGRDRNGRNNVAVAVAQDDQYRGVFLSINAGDERTFRRLDGLENTDIRVLEVGRHDIHDYLWAGIMDFAPSGLKGVHRWRLIGAENPPGGWERLDGGWTKAGSCLDIAIGPEVVFAATAKGGALRLNLGDAERRWITPGLDSGLRPAGDGDFAEVTSVGYDPADGGLLLVGGETGVFGSQDGTAFERVSVREFTDRVTLPAGWLPCSGEHAIEVVHEHDVPRD